MIYSISPAPLPEHCECDVIPFIAQAELGALLCSASQRFITAGCLHPLRSSLNGLLGEHTKYKHFVPLHCERGQLPRTPSDRDAKVSIGSEAARDSCAVELSSVCFAPHHLLSR